MKARLLVVGVIFAAGCGFSAAGTGVGSNATDAGLDAAISDDGAGAEGGGDPIPGQGSSQIPIGDLDGGVDAETDASTDASTPAPSFQIIAPPKGKFTILTPGAAKPCSGDGMMAASFTVKNFSAETVRIRWVDGLCVEHDYGTVSPGNAKMQPTFVTHRWRIRSDVNMAIRGDFVLGAPGAYDVIVR